MSWAPCQELWQGPSPFHPLQHTQARPEVKFYEGRLWLAAGSHSPYDGWFSAQAFMPKISTRVCTSLYSTMRIHNMKCFLFPVLLFGYVYPLDEVGPPGPQPLAIRPSLLHLVFVPFFFATCPMERSHSRLHGLKWRQTRSHWCYKMANN